jgi:prepilin peptidase CpaA
MNFELIPFSILATVLIIGAAWDLRFHKIPNWLTFPAIGLAIAYHTSMNGFSGFFFSLEGMTAGIAILLPFYLLGGMGAGDVKLLGAVGGLLGPKGVFLAFLFTALVGGIYALILLASHGYLKKTILRYRIIVEIFILSRNIVYIPPTPSEGKPRLWYGLAISLGTFLSIGFGSHIL